MEHSDWVDAFPALSKLNEPLRLQLVQGAVLVTVPAGSVVFQEGGGCQNYLLVLEGSVRVQKLSESGREIVLYRVEAGQSCVLTTSCLLAGESYSAEGIAETEVRAVVVPKALFQQLLANSEQFREFVFALFGERIAGLVMLIDAIAFGRMDGRLAATLDRMAIHSEIIEITHQNLARELGTAREVVSRLLKEFERHGWLELKRGQILLRDRDALRGLVR
ncbi:MAG: Crp/Fnr family transcriptional regulator [Gammaproteobacteria bacterium]|nr:Crp/Fnr family transcriptional regulator [Gammaproteobacteria bacterium]MBU1656107.1 Crp/Fnr family transcriptional regulator [Gammaproteobacteria bacterium]MBU1962192.1 Crp/Fnr family transcriptional regulator [Gammaproteobacteria bacterium]